MQQSLYFQTEQPVVYQDTHSNITSPDRAIFASMMSCKYTLCAVRLGRSLTPNIRPKHKKY